MLFARHFAPAGMVNIMTKHLTSFLARTLSGVTPQSEPMPGTSQVPNSAGGYAFAADEWTRLQRFLILGSEGGSYYASERTLTAENANAVFRCLDLDGARAVAQIVAVSVAGRAPKNDPALFALAIAASCDQDETRRLALAALPKVARTGTHLFHFAAFVQAQRGWGRGLRAAVARWYGEKSPRDLVYQTLKYQARDNWSHRDLLRLSHPTPQSDEQQIVFHWATQGWPSVGEGVHPVEEVRGLWAFETIKRASDAAHVAQMVREFDLPREAIPTQFLTSPEVWEALLERMPMTALIRNLATMTKIGLLSAGSQATARVVEQFGDAARLQKARVHPIAVLSALKTYASGRGVRGNATWTPVSAITDALDGAFYASFGAVEASDKRHLLALDVSGSMGCGQIAGVAGLTPRVAAGAMALVTGAVENKTEFVAFSHELTPVDLSARRRLDDVLTQLDGIPMGGTDCALPMLWAAKHKREVDAFVVYTDSETWLGGVHPVQALRQYREAMGIDARLIVVGMVSNGFTIADPNDGGMLDVVGFDTAAPQVMSDFARGSV